MSYLSLLINWCRVEEDIGGAPDVYGGKAEDWQPVDGLEDIPCRLMSGAGKEILVGAEVVIADYKLFLGDVVITEQNRVYVETKDPTGVWVGVTYEILLVNDIQNGVNGHHKECYLRTVR